MVKKVIALMTILCMICSIFLSVNFTWADIQELDLDVENPTEISIPEDWAHIVSDHFDVSEKTPIAQYDGGMGFASLWSADLACTDSSDEAFKKQVANESRQSVPEIAEGGYFSRVTKATGPIAYRKMNEPINTIVDGEYYIKFDFYANTDGQLSTHQRLSFVDSTNSSQAIHFGTHTVPSIKKAVLTVGTGGWQMGNPSTHVISPFPTVLFQHNGLYTIVMHISARASAQDVIRIRAYYNDPNGDIVDEAPSFTPSRWDIQARLNLSYANLDVLSFQSGWGSGGSYTAQFDNLDIYKGAPIKVTSNYESSEVSLVTGRTLTLADIPQTNAIGNAQSLESIEWIDNSVGECLSTDMSFTIPDTMENHILNAKVVIKDTVTGKLTTYYPINEYIRSNVDILAMYFGNSDGRKGINESNLAETNPFVLRADIARNNVDFKTGEVQIALEQYSEYDTLKATHSSTAIQYTYSKSKVSDISVKSAKKYIVTISSVIDGVNQYEPGDYFIAKAYYIPDPSNPDEKTELPIAQGIMSSQFLDTELIVPGGKLLKLPQLWRSKLYPEDWTPEFRDEKGRFFHDFSYAGYHRGEDPIPDNPPGDIYNVVEQFYADPTGQLDSTMAIQNAIDAAGSAGGGVVYLPPGTYSIKPVEGKNYALLMNKSNVVLKGAGNDKTFIYVNDTYVRNKNIISLQGPAWYYPSSGTEKTITQDLLEPTKEIPVNDVSGYNVGDWIMVALQRKVTEEFAEEVGEPTWAGPNGVDSIVYYRQITAIDSERNIITIDVPIRHALLMRDGARTYKLGSVVSELGLQDFSIGMKENTKPNSDDGKDKPDVGKAWGENDHSKEGTKGWDCHNSFAIFIAGITNGWVKNISSYRPEGNENGTHIASNAIWVHQSRGITVENCRFTNTNYQGGAGNGYAFMLGGNENLYINNYAEKTRHGYSFRQMATSGNVLYNNTSKDNLYVDDFHQHYSHSCLIDNHNMNGIGFDAKYRAYGTIKHGQVTTESVFWNCKDGIVTTKQWGYGYAIGCDSVNNTLGLGDTTVPVDYVEGTGKGSGLFPQSLYYDQLNRRLNRNNVVIQSVDLTNAENIRLTDNGLVNNDIIIKAVLNYNKAVGDPKVFAALYKKITNELVSLKFANMTEEPYTFVIESFDMSELDPSEYYLKIFAWDSLQNLTELIRQPIIFDDSGRVQ